MIALSLVRLIERNSDELAAELVVKLETSSHTTDLRKVPVEELRGRIQAGNRGREPQTSSRVTRAQCTPYGVFIVGPKGGLVEKLSENSCYS